MNGIIINSFTKHISNIIDTSGSYRLLILVVMFVHYVKDLSNILRYVLTLLGFCVVFGGFAYYVLVADLFSVLGFYLLFSL